MVLHQFWLCCAFSFALLVLVVQAADGYAYVFENSCKVNLRPGNEIMSNKILLGNPRRIEVFRGDSVIASGSQYVPGESLTVKLVPTDTQFAFQIISGEARFEDGTCSNKRIANRDSAIMVMPSPGGGDVEIVAGSASQFGQVKLTEPFKLTAIPSPMTISLTPKVSPLPSPQPQLNGIREKTAPVGPAGPTRKFKRHLQVAVAATAPPTWSSTLPSQSSPTANIVLPHLPTDPVVVFTITQQVTNLDNAELDKEAVRSAFVGAMTRSIEPVGAPDSVFISKHQPCPDRVRNKNRLSTLITYNVTYSLDGTGFKSASALHYALNIQLYRALDSGLFRSYLSSSNLPELDTVTGTVLKELLTQPNSNSNSSVPNFVLVVTNNPVTAPVVAPSTAAVGAPAESVVNSTSTLTFEVQQQVISFLSSSLDDPRAKEAFIGAMRQSLLPLAPPKLVEITSYSPLGDRVTNKDRDVTLIVYHIAYDLGETPFRNESELSYNLQLRLYQSLDSNEFQSYLQGYDVPALGTVFQTVLGRVSTAGSVLVDSPLPEGGSPVGDIAAPPMSSTRLLASGISGASAKDWQPHSTLGRIAIGVGVGIGSAAILVVGVWCYLKNYRRFRKTDCSIFVAMTSVLLVAAAVALLSFWVQAPPPASPNDRNYLGGLHWHSNVFAFHPLLMVCGLVAAPVLAISAWTAFSSRRLAKVVHILFQTAGICTAGVGLYAVLSANGEWRTPRLSTMHSWLGVAAIGVVSTNYLLGWSMGIVATCYPHSLMVRAVAMKRIHRAIGLAALGLSTAAVLTGIADRLPQGSCYYALPAGSIDADPALHYGDLPSSCKLAYGVGICVVCAALCTVLGVSLRHDDVDIIDSR